MFVVAVRISDAAPWRRVQPDLVAADAAHAAGDAGLLRGQHAQQDLRHHHGLALQQGIH